MFWAMGGEGEYDFCCKSSPTIIKSNCWDIPSGPRKFNSRPPKTGHCYADNSASACAFCSQDSYNLVLSMGKSYATLDEMWKRIPLFSSEGLSEQSLHSSILFCAIWLRAMEKRTNYFFFSFYQSTQNFLVSFFFSFSFWIPKSIG